ncbi:sporulation protein YqfD [Anoxybacter fermentans]|uniref:Sporulation protein YqfD n=1 Tax=Anoxybacter fermentans TaxID=1323375 RepID=A0A3Q9HQB2_9FIRM|nr:sporulation protein YqfD [Anoxybacter fermentans]AZR73157.1 sporulation protein YqfD [Anoxybacter fermentans]
MIKAIWRYIKGYVVVELKGNALERLLNKMSNFGIELWDIRRITHGFRFKMNAGDYYRLRPLIRYRKCTARIYKKKGLPFIKFRIGRRKAMIIGILFFFILLKAFSSFLWFIEIEGNKRVTTEEIKKLILKSGIRRGMLLNHVNLSRLERTILIDLKEISWVDASLQGTKLQIKIVEKKLIKKESLTDIIAARSGVITQLIVLHGKPVVKEGDTVKAGQLLIKAANRYETFAEPDYEGNLPPYLPPADEEPESARGIVKARVWYEGYGEAPITVVEEWPTGKREKIVQLKIGSKIFHLSGPRKINYQHYQVEKRVKSFSLWRNMTLPIEIIKEEYIETVIYKEKRTRDTAIFLAKDEALRSILNSLSSDAIIIQSKSFIIDDGKKENNIVRVKVLLEVEEDIAKPLSREVKEEG